MGRSQSLPRGGDPRFGPDADDSASPILHVDMDAFFASVEVRHRPELRGLPVVVGGVGPRGVVSSASYEARRFGVRSAMPTARARALCPGAVYLPPDFARYRAASDAVMRIFRDVTPLVEPLSLDEAFLDVAGARRLFGPPAAIARRIRERVTAEQGLTCSVGVGPSKFVAKLGSTRAKPDGVLVVPADRVLEFLHPLPVDALWGVGERSAETLRRLGLRTIGDLAEAPVGMLRKALGAASATHLHELARGRDPRPVSPEHVEKSIGAEVTFDVDVVDPQQIRRALLALSEKVGSRLRGAGQVGRTVSLKVRLSDFRTVNRSRTLGVATDVAREIFDTSWDLWTVLDPGEPVRLVGVRVESLAGAVDTPRQLTLGAPERGWREAETAADAAAARFGRSVIGPASLLGRRDAGPGENSSRP
ncbi:DNA polymerase IV [Micromonospora sp.]|uniref:DNA polymerase IV n=1 Tax=unclassified Micromonospora TaxID=2617518 RepID=UPI003B3BE7E0